MLYKDLRGVVFGPYTPGLTPFEAVLLIVPRDTGDFWLAMAAEERVTDALAARIAALMTIHRQYPILHPTVHPRHEAPPSAYFQSNGIIQTQQVVLPSRLVREVDRVAGVLRQDHVEYIAAAASSLRGQRSTVFRPLPSDCGFVDPNNEYSWAPPPPESEVNAAEITPFDDPEVFFHLVNRDYQKERYLQQLSDDEVVERAHDAVVSSHNFQDPGKILIDLSDRSVILALARMGEAMEEFRLRHGSSDPLIEKLSVSWRVDSRNPLIAPVVSFVSQWTDSPTDGLAKYGRREHLREALEHGRIRLSPAAYYSDPTLNRARQASELALTVEIDPERTKFEILNEERTEVLGTFKPLQATITRSAGSNFLVFCTSRRISARLFLDFDSDACLIIRDRGEFIRRLTIACGRTLPGWSLRQRDIVYYDSYSPKARHASIPFWKPLRYDYQSEHRIVLVPPVPQYDLDHVIVELGPLHDIATLFVPDAGVSE